MFTPIARRLAGTRAGRPGPRSPESRAHGCVQLLREPQAAGVTRLLASLPGRHYTGHPRYQVRSDPARRNRERKVSLRFGTGAELRHYPSHAGDRRQCEVFAGCPLQQASTEAQAGRLTKCARRKKIW